MLSELANAALSGLAEQGMLAVGVLQEGRIAWASRALLLMFRLETTAGAGRHLLSRVEAEHR